ncbi:MAG: hypothetical protein ACHP7M_00875 [Burkholderiales bacterium]
MQYSETRVVSEVAPAGHATMKWSAIFGGWLLAMAMASLMYVAGLAMGFTAMDPYNVEASAKGIAAGTAVWVILTSAVALFLGGMFASWFDGRSDQTVGTLHGVTVWALSIAASGLLLALGLAQVIQGGAAMGRGAAATGAAAALATGSQMTPRSPISGPTADAITGLQAQITQRVGQAAARSIVPNAGDQLSADPDAFTAAQTTGVAAKTEPENRASPTDARSATGQVDRQAMAAVARALLSGQTDNAKMLLAASTGMPQSQVDQTLTDLSAQVEKYKADLRAAAAATAHYTAMAMWIIFLSSLIALVAAGVGGWMGAGHIHRVHHARRIESVPSPTL